MSVSRTYTVAAGSRDQAAHVDRALTDDGPTDDAGRALTGRAVGTAVDSFVGTLLFDPVLARSVLAEDASR